MEFVFALIILIFSVILHEVSHGYMANYLGDPTARLAGRLTLNPVPHIDPLGSVILPLFLLISQSVTNFPLLIGYAKPVPYNPDNLPGKYDEALVAGAGPAVNIFLALFFGLLIRFGGVSMSEATLSAFAVIVYINLLLALFNLIPLPPLDGSKILSVILPGRAGVVYGHFRANFERLGILSGTLLLLAVFYLLSPYFFAGMQRLFLLITGVAL